MVMMIAMVSASNTAGTHTYFWYSKFSLETEMPAIAKNNTSSMMMSTMIQTVVELYQGMITFLNTGFLSEGIGLSFWYLNRA